MDYFFLISNQFFLIWSQVRLFWQTAHVDKRSKTVIFREFWTKIAKNYQKYSKTIKRFQIEKLKVLNLLTTNWLLNLSLRHFFGDSRTKVGFPDKMSVSEFIINHPYPKIFYGSWFGYLWTNPKIYLLSSPGTDGRLRSGVSWSHEDTWWITVKDISHVLLIKTIRHLHHLKAMDNLSKINWNYWTNFPYSISWNSHFYKNGTKTCSKIWNFENFYFLNL